MRSLTEPRKKYIAGKQFYKCANNQNAKIPGLESYKCPLWNKNESNYSGSFDESGYEIDHVSEFSISKDDSEYNLQALCKSCHSVKTKKFLMGNKIICNNAIDTNEKYKTILDDLEDNISNNNNNTENNNSEISDVCNTDLNSITNNEAMYNTLICINEINNKIKMLTLNFKKLKKDNEEINNLRQQLEINNLRQQLEIERLKQTFDESKKKYKKNNGDIVNNSEKINSFRKFINNEYTVTKNKKDFITLYKLRLEYDAYCKTNNLTIISKNDVIQQVKAMDILGVKFREKTNRVMNGKAMSLKNLIIGIKKV